VSALRLGIAGLGTVGGGVLRMLHDNAALITARAGRPITVTAVSARDRGRARSADLSAAQWHDNPVALANDPAVDVVVELIGGSEGPARALVEAALAAGKSVVTANKALLAVHGGSLAALAERGRLSLCFEAAVAGGIPVIKALREGLAGNHIHAVAGILNGTCNYILTVMRERGREFEEVLAEAQALGYAESDPSFDIDGIDAAHKLAILAAIAFGRPVAFEAVHIEGIRAITALDITHATELGYRIKLLGIARRLPAGITARVHPCLVPLAAPIARVDGVFNAVGCGLRRPIRCAIDADVRPYRRLLSAPDGGRPPRRDRRRHRRAARPGHLARIHAATRPLPRRGGGSGPRHPRNHRSRHARRPRAHHRPRRRARAARPDTHRKRLKPRLQGRQEGYPQMSQMTRMSKFNRSVRLSFLPDLCNLRHLRIPLLAATRRYKCE
jgi:homoserine dehydrogenase